MAYLPGYITGQPQKTCSVILGGLLLQCAMILMVAMKDGSNLIDGKTLGTGQVLCFFPVSDGDRDPPVEHCV